MSQFGQPMICVVGLERANRLLLDHDEQLVAPPLPFSRFIEGGYLRYLPEETHATYRRFFRTLFHSDVATSAEPRIAATFAIRFDKPKNAVIAAMSQISSSSNPCACRRA